MRVDRTSNGLRQCVPSANVTKPYLELETYVAPNVDHVVVCTCHSIYLGYCEHVFGCAECIQ